MSRDDNWRRPSVASDEDVLWDEPGRILQWGEDGKKTDCTSHHFLVVKPMYGRCALKVRHGAGDESFNLTWDREGVQRIFSALPSDERFRLCWIIMDAYKDGAKQAQTATKQQYIQAFADGRLKKRKVRGQPKVKVWIESSPVQP